MLNLMRSFSQPPAPTGIVADSYPHTQRLSMRRHVGGTVWRHPSSVAVFLLSTALLALLPRTSHAVGVSDDAPAGQPNGFTFLSDAPNVTHWGIGAGVGVEASPYRGYGANVNPLPVLYFDDKWVHAFGTTLDVKVGSYDHVSLSLRAKYALGDGYKGSDAPILNGMQTRNGAFWIGPHLSWESAIGELSGSFLTGGNKGQRGNIDFSHSFRLGGVRIVPHVGAEWDSNKYVGYYYGVMPAEVRSDRAAYTGKAAFEEEIGTRVDYRLTRHQLLSLDVGVTHLDSGITNSPLVSKRYIPQVKFAYIYQFK